MTENTARINRLREMAATLEKDFTLVGDDGATLLDPIIADAVILLKDAASTIEELLGGYVLPDYRKECRNVSGSKYFFECSNCGVIHMRNPAYIDTPSYCPNCGRRVV